MAVRLTSRVLIVVLLVFNLSDLFHIAHCTTLEYLKLRLHHIKSFTTPSQAIAFDSHRLSALFSALHGHQGLKSPLTSGASFGSGQYFVDLRIGTPPQSLLLVADTGSDLVWVKCSACRNCSLHRPGSAFFARHSATFAPIHCFDSACRLVPHSSTRHRLCRPTRLHSPCWYEYQYSDGSLTSGLFFTETSSLNTSSGRETTLGGLALGCGFEVSGPSITGPSFNGADGVMGLGRGPTSFSAQLGRRFGNRFSYCLLDYTLSPPPTSYLMIGGAHGVVSGHYKMSSTPLLTNRLFPTFYYIAIKTVIIDGVKLPINPSVWALDDFGNGGTIIDSGTTLSFVPEPAYRLILTAFSRRVKLPQLDKPSPGFDLCVNVSGVSRPSLPKMSFVMLGDSVFAPPPSNYFIDTAEGVKCLAVQSVASPSGFAVIGNLMQQGFLFEFDNDSSRLRFSRKACGRK
ncbi:hypothetical protein Nepgr_028052 [Nepenthes gracilis]|uniref:Peptidase A1 domain-containing protein n=1 Tax=Nepenthes gracilis TaxID=150966 RepID=A0AAD3TC33_NEPGR|nr:hypothetical protein Nepgr_028052 [Nepenthes gracilis]